MIADPKGINSGQIPLGWQGFLFPFLQLFQRVMLLFLRQNREFFTYANWSSSVRTQHQTSTFLTPPAFNTRVSSSAVAPVVRTSSRMATC